MKDIECQCALTTGDYEGGKLMASNEEETLCLKIDTPNNPTLVDGRIPHRVTLVLSGIRYHLIIYRHYEANFPGQHDIYDVVQFHPDSKPTCILDRDGFYVPFLKGLDSVHEMVDEFLFDNSCPKSLKACFRKSLKNNFLFEEGGEKVGLDDNRYSLQDVSLREEVVAAVSTAMRSVWVDMDIDAETNPKITDFGFLLRTDGCGIQPIHIDGELDNFFAIVPILNPGEEYKIKALKVSDGGYNVFFKM